MKKHAYLIIAHNEPYILDTLVQMIDDCRNDIFIMIDLKSDIKQFDGIRTKKSRLTFLQNRVNIQWAEDSQMRAELRLFEAARKDMHYSYYHLLSGVDLPLKSQDEIHRFFKRHDGTEFIEIGIDDDELEHKTRYFTLNYRLMCRGPKAWRSFWRIMNSGIKYIQKICRIQRQYDGLELKKGANWVSITDDFVTYLLNRKDYILKLFKGIPCVDELYKQTILWNSHFRKNIYHTNDDTASLRELDWSRGKPYTWRMEDYDHLTTCHKMFARKFSTSVDQNIIDALKHTIISKTKESLDEN